MRMKVKVLYNQAKTESYRLDDFPDSCPVCHRTAVIEPEIPHPMLIPPSAQARKKRLQLLCRCPSAECGSLFIAEYDRQAGGGQRHLYVVRRFAPFTPRPFEVFEGVADVSPNFVKIVNEATQADQHRLLSIACIGFRRALKCLIKDHCIRQNPEHTALIKKMPLGRCIAEYVKEAKLRQAAEPFTWLGTDESQYERTWTDQDLVVLKNLISLAQLSITTDLLAERVTRKQRSAAPR